MLILVCEVQKVKDVNIFVPFHSATVETCMELVGHFAVDCQFVPVVLLLQETQAFRPQTRQGGAKVPRQLCQGGHGSIC